MVDIILFFFFKQKTAYEMRISDWSSDVCSSDLEEDAFLGEDMPGAERRPQRHERADPEDETACRDGKRAERRGARMGETVHIQHSVVIDRAAVAGLREEEIGPQATADEADNRRRDDDERKGRLEAEGGDEGGRGDGVER